MKTITLFKVLNEDGTPFWGGSGHWDLPANGLPGEWMPKINNIEPCHIGYHLYRGAEHLLHWLGPVIYGVEVRGEIVETENEIIVGECRLVCKVDTWNDRTARLFACDCSERVLPLFERQRPDDDRPRTAISVARRFAHGKATQNRLNAAGSAAWTAAWDAGRNATWTVARGAARSAAWTAAWDAAWDAARSAAWDAVKATTGSAARVAEREWQVERLRQYLNGEVK